MERITMNCTLLTPLFSHGARRGEAELRSTELKGAMRNTYRIVCFSNLETLIKDEAELFGSASGAISEAGHASPIRLMLRGRMVSTREKLLMHDKKKKVGTIGCFRKGTFKITASFNSPILKAPGFCKQVDLNWYGDLLELSLIISGMGQRSRKARGCFQINRTKFSGRDEFLNWLCCILNKVKATGSSESTGSRHYERTDDSEGEIVPVPAPYNLSRPFLYKIRLGERLEEEKIEEYLCLVDRMCHDLKDRKLKSDRAPYQALDSDITGNFEERKGKFASPLLFRIVKTNEGCYPLYIFIKGIRNIKEIDSDYSQREQFVKILESERKGVK